MFMEYLASWTMCTMASLARRSCDVSAADCHKPVKTKRASSLTINFTATTQRFKTNNFLTIMYRKGTKRGAKLLDPLL